MGIPHLRQHMQEDMSGTKGVWASLLSHFPKRGCEGWTIERRGTQKLAKAIRATAMKGPRVRCRKHAGQAAHRGGRLSGAREGTAGVELGKGSLNVYTAVRSGNKKAQR